MHVCDEEIREVRGANNRKTNGMARAKDAYEIRMR